MGFLRVLGWIFIPFIMIFFRWKKIGVISKVFGIPWALVALLIFIGIAAGEQKPDDNVSTSTTASVNNEQKSDSTASNKANDEAKAKAEAEEKAKKEAEEKAKAKAEKAKTKSADLIKNFVPQVTEGIEVDNTTYNFIVNNYKLFPAKSAADIQAAQSKIESSITAKHLMKNIQPYFGKMVQFSGQVVSVEETNIDSGTVAYLHIMTQNGDSITAIYPDTTGDLLEDDFATIVGLPTAYYAFQNVSGGHTNAILLSAAIVKKNK